MRLIEYRKIRYLVEYRDVFIDILYLVEYRDIFIDTPILWVLIRCIPF